MEPGEQLRAEDLDIAITDLPDNEQAEHEDNQAQQQRPRTQTHPKRRWRLLRLGTVLVAGVLCLLLFLQSAPGASSILVNSIFGQTPAPTPVVGGINVLYIDASPSWGRLSIDGQNVAHPPIEGKGQPMRLASGRHSFLWQAAPFPPQSCVLTLPANVGTSGSCLTTETVQTPNGELALKIFLQNSLLTLSIRQQQALTTRIQQSLNALSTSDIVRPGEHFLSTHPTAAQPFDPIQIARQPLRATLNFTLVHDENYPCTGLGELSACKTDGQSCYALCTPVALGCTIFCPPANTGNFWYALAVVRVFWTYTTLNGQVVAADQDDGLNGAAGIAHLVVLRINRNGQQWSVQASPTFIGLPFACASTTDISGSFSTVSSAKVSPATNSASGCLIILNLQANSTSAPGIQMVILHRFGVNLAVDTLTRQINPSSMPLPDAYEMQLAQQLEARASGSS